MQGFYNNKKSRESGFNLMELMIALLILAVIASLAFPSFRETMRRNKVQAQTTKLMSSLTLARNEAVKTNKSTVLCKSANQATCTTAGFWDQGWIIYRDDDADGIKDAGEQIINVSGPVGQEVNVRAGASFANLVAFRPDGTTGFLLHNSTDQSFRLCYSLDKTYSRQVFLDASGRPRVDVTGVASCAF